MSRTFSRNSGSVDSLQVSLRGCSEKARQMRCTVDGARPDALAIDRVLQCVAAVGGVVVSTSATLSSILRGAPAEDILASIERFCRRSGAVHAQCG